MGHESVTTPKPFKFYNFCFIILCCYVNVLSDKRVRGAPKGGLRTQEFRKEPSYDGDVCPCEV